MCHGPIWFNVNPCHSLGTYCLDGKDLVKASPFKIPPTKPENDEERKIIGSPKWDATHSSDSNKYGWTR